MKYTVIKEIDPIKNNNKPLLDIYPNKFRIIRNINQLDENCCIYYMNSTILGHALDMTVCAKWIIIIITILIQFVLKTTKLFYGGTWLE